MKQIKYNRLEIVGDRYLKGGRFFVKCLCECGKYLEIREYSVVSGATKSCGCLRKERSYKTHGKYKSKMYRVWASMISRCSNRNDPSWKYYGGVGISVDESWKDFESFDCDMGGSYKEGLTIERLDVENGYNKNNCCWVGWKEQSFNKGRYKNSKSPKTGVSELKNKKWHARIGVSGKDVNLGVFCSLEEAVKAREDAEIKFFGKKKGH